MIYAWQIGELQRKCSLLCCMYAVSFMISRRLPNLWCCFCLRLRPFVFMINSLGHNDAFSCCLYTILNCHAWWLVCYIHLYGLYLPLANIRVTRVPERTIKTPTFPRLFTSYFFLAFITEYSSILLYHDNFIFYNVYLASRDGSLPILDVFRPSSFFYIWISIFVQDSRSTWEKWSLVWAYVASI